jgi:hypothetical protein
MVLLNLYMELRDSEPLYGNVPRRGAPRLTNVLDI